MSPCSEEIPTKGYTVSRREVFALEFQPLAFHAQTLRAVITPAEFDQVAAQFTQ